MAKTSSHIKKKSEYDAFPSAAAHFNVCLDSAILYLTFHLQARVFTNGDAQKILQHYPFLQRHFHNVLTQYPEDIHWHEVLRRHTEEIDKRRKYTRLFLPLAALQEVTQLGDAEIHALLLIGAQEDETQIGNIFAACLNKQQPCRATLGLVNRICQTAFSEKAPQLPLDWNALFNSGMLEVLNADAPRVNWELRIPPMLWDMLKGVTVQNLPELYTLYNTQKALPLKDLQLGETLLKRVKAVTPMIKCGDLQVVIIRGTPGSDRMALAQSIAKSCGQNLLILPAGSESAEKNISGQMCVLTNAIPTLTYDLAPSESAIIPRLLPYHGVKFIILGRHGNISDDTLGNTVTLSIPDLSFTQRRAIWRSAFAGNRVTELDTIARRFYLPGKYIRKTAKQAVNEARLCKQKVISVNHVHTATQWLNRQALEKLALYLPAVPRGQKIIVDENTQTGLDELMCRCEQREELINRVGSAFEDNFNRGVRALLRGPSGTGKTLSAKILSSQLKLDLYRVDLAAVVNKYIGETEKNLNEVFSAAEELDVILLLDEGDTLMSNRTQVKSSNDRYANLETNFLLQRLENYSGIVLITTNANENIDSAFRRRIDVDVQFHLPEAGERLHIWQLHLPANHAIAYRDLENIALRCVLSGGQIRNAVLFAATQTLDQKSEQISLDHILAGIENEYTKAGRVSPLHATSDNSLQMDQYNQLTHVLRMAVQ